MKAPKRRNTLCISSFGVCTVGAKDPLITADGFVSGYLLQYHTAIDTDHLTGDKGGIG